MELCDRNCNSCPVVGHSNSRLLTKILNDAFDKFGEDFETIVLGHCPNMTVCHECRIGDFCHAEGCTITEDDAQLVTPISPSSP